MAYYVSEPVMPLEVSIDYHWYIGGERAGQRVVPGAQRPSHRIVIQDRYLPSLSTDEIIHYKPWRTREYNYHVTSFMFPGLRVVVGAFIAELRTAVPRESQLAGAIVKLRADYAELRPAGFPMPRTTDDMLVIADVYEDSGMTQEAERARNLAEYTPSLYAIRHTFWSHTDVADEH